MSGSGSASASALASGPGSGSPGEALLEALKGLDLNLDLYLQSLNLKSSDFLALGNDIREVLKKAAALNSLDLDLDYELDEKTNSKEITKAKYNSKRKSD